MSLRERRMLPKEFKRLISEYGLDQRGLKRLLRELGLLLRELIISLKRLRMLPKKLRM